MCLVSVSNISYNIKILFVPAVKHTLILGKKFLKTFNIEANSNDLWFHFLKSSHFVVNITLESFSELCVKIHTAFVSSHVKIPQ